MVYKNEFDADGKAGYAAVFTIYLPANPGKADDTGKYKSVEEGTVVPQSWMYPFEINVKYKNDIKDDANNDKITETLTRKFDIDIPVKRNWLTTVDAEYFWTDNSNIKVSINSRFDGFIKVEPETIYVKTEKELKEAIKITDFNPSVGSIVLGADIEMDKYTTFAIGDPSEDGNHKDISITIDLNGHYMATTKQADNYYGDNSVFNVYASYSQQISRTNVRLAS